MWGNLQKKYLGSTIPIINIHGMITSSMAEKVLWNLSKINPTTASALAVSINSRGGYPVQSQIIGNKIRSFARKNNLKVYTFAGDYAASGGYFILCMGDQVYADRVSLVGSIGVVSTKLNLQGIKKYGVDSYSISSNDHTLTDMMNPFHDIKPQQKQMITKELDHTHQKFIQHVKKYRGSKIKAQNSQQIFGADVFSGQKSKELGLIDGIGTMTQILYEKHPEAKYQIPKDRSLFKKILSPL